MNPSSLAAAALLAAAIATSASAAESRGRVKEELRAALEERAELPKAPPVLPDTASPKALQNVPDHAFGKRGAERRARAHARERAAEASERARADAARGTGPQGQGAAASADRGGGDEGSRGAAGQQRTNKERDKGPGRPGGGPPDRKPLTR